MWIESGNAHSSAGCPICSWTRVGLTLNRMFHHLSSQFPSAHEEMSRKWNTQNSTQPSPRAGETPCIQLKLTCCSVRRGRSAVWLPFSMVATTISMASSPLPSSLSGSARRRLSHSDLELSAAFSCILAFCIGGMMIRKRAWQRLSQIWGKWGRSFGTFTYRAILLIVEQFYQNNITISAVL